MVQRIVVGFFILLALLAVAYPFGGLLGQAIVSDRCRELGFNGGRFTLGYSAECSAERLEDVDYKFIPLEKARMLAEQ
jgi:hypothetical protein